MKTWQAPTRRIAALVTTGHLVVIGLFLTTGFIERRLKLEPEPEPEKPYEVRWDDEEPPQTEDTDVTPSPAPPPVPEPPEPPAPEPAPVAPPPPAPKPPAPAPPASAPASLPKSVVKAPPKQVEKLEFKPKSVKPAKSAPKPKRTYRSPADIRRQMARNFKPAPRVAPVPAPPTVDARDIARNLRQGLFDVSVVATPASRSPRSSTDVARSQRWFEAVGAELYRLWGQPTRAEVGRGNPRANVSLTVSSDGRVISARLTGASRIDAMDSTIDHLLSTLKRVPGFGAYGLDGTARTVTVAFRIR